LGRLMVQAAIEESKKRNIDVLWCNAREEAVNFYEKLGFTVFAGDIEKNYLIMKNGDALVGLFQGMFEKNILTFNPGWNADAEKLEDFDDVREIQEKLKESKVDLVKEADPNTSGPESITLIDPDGNPVLIDQHV